MHTSLLTLLILYLSAQYKSCIHTHTLLYTQGRGHEMRELALWSQMVPPLPFPSRVEVAVYVINLQVRVRVMHILCLLFYMPPPICITIPLSIYPHTHLPTYSYIFLSIYPSKTIHHPPTTYPSTHISPSPYNRPRMTPMAPPIRGPRAGDSTTASYLQVCVCVCVHVSIPFSAPSHHFNYN